MAGGLMAKKDYSADALIQADVNRQLSQQQNKPVEQVQPQQPTYRTNIRGSNITPSTGSNDFILPESETLNPLPAIEDWDYKTATSDRQGKVPLSYKLGDWEVKPQGFDANGDLYFGQGLNGWFKKLAYQTLDIAWGEEIQATEQKKIISDGFKKIQDVNFDVGYVNPMDEQAVEESQAKAKEDLGQVTSGIWDVIKGTWGLAGSKGSALEVPVKGVNLAAKTVIDAFQLVADTTEQVLGMNKTMRRYADEQGSQMPDVLEVDFDPIKIGEDYAIQDELVNTFLRNVTPVLNAYDAIRFWTAPGTFKQKTEALKTGWYESRMLYTELVKPSVEQEFLRRVQAGENPDLLAIEMQDPYAELVGELIFDPLNLVAGTAKANKFKNMVETAQDLGGVSDEITDILKIGSQGTTEAQISASLDQAVDKIIDFGYRKVDDGSTVQKVIGKLEYKATSLNVRGMVTQKSKSMSEFTTWVAGFVKSKGGTPDDVLDTLGALVKMTSDKTDEVKAGLSYINSSKMVSHPMAFFGQQALETGHMIRNLMGKGDNVEKFLTKIKTASWDDQAKLIDELLSNSAKNAYPTIAEMSVAYNKIGNLDEVTTKLNRIQDLENRIKTASKTEIKNIKNEIATLKTGLPSNKEIGLAKEYARIAKERPSLVTLAKFDNEISNVWKQVNSVFSNIYFTQYGFAARQWISNSFMVFKEGGVNAFFRDGGFKTMTHIEQELAQAFPAGLPAALNPKSIVESVEVADNFITTAFKNFKGWKYSPQAFAEATERGAGLRVFYKYYRDTMDNMMDFGKGLPKLEEWTAKGFTAEMANDYKTILRSNGYNPTKAKEIFTQQYKNGTELFRDLGWVSEDVQKGLKDYGGWDELVNFVKNPETKTTEQITSFIEDMIDDVGRRANQTIYNPNAVSKERATDYIEQFGGNQKEIVGYRELQTHVSNAETAAIDAFRSDFTNASASARKTVQGLIDRASQGGKLTPDETTQLSQLNEWLRKADLHMSKSEEIYTQNGERLKQLKKELDTWLSENKQYRYGDAPREKKWQDWYKAVEKTREDYFNFYNGGGAKLQEDYAMVMGIEPATTFARSRKATVEVQRAKQIISGRKGGIFHTPPKGFGYSKVGESGHDLNVRKLAEYFGVPTQKQALLNVINKYSEKKFTSIFDVSLEDAQKALQQKTGIDADFVKRLKGETTEEIVKKTKDIPADVKITRTELKAGSVVDDTRGLIPASPIHPGGTAGFNDANAWAEGKEGLTKALKYIEQGLLERVGRRGLDVLDDAKSFDLDEIQKLVMSRAEEAKLTATKVGSAYRDFALLPYGETTNLDHAMQFVFPYHFWYTRTYQNFAKSLVTNADMIAGYGKFKDFMATKYKEQPEWYKYNVKFPDFFGTNNGNPYMFNLESAIWPLQGITGTDFNNPQKRANWFTATLDDLGKFGPSTWTPISMAVAAYYKIKGDDELSAAWGTRAIPQTALVKAVSSYFGNPIELDPNVQLFQGGLDPYEEGRVSRALASMENEGVYTPEQLLEAARTHSGEAWDEAYIRATQQRAPGQILSSLFGVAFRPRTEDDIQTDNFYQDYNRMRNLHDSGLMSDEQYKQGFNQLREQYPFMDIILLSRRAGVGREEAYVYNVISRIPPGMSKEVYEKIGIDPETAQKFFDSGGKLEGMSETERARFIASFIDAGTMLAIPSNATRREWTSAKNMYGEMQKALKLSYGDDILDEIELYFNIDDVDKARLFLKTHPEVELALDDQQSYIVNNPQLMKFYGGLDTLDRFYSSSMYDELEKQFGENIVDLETQYFMFDKADRTAFLKQNPQLKKYWEEKSRLKEENSRKVVEFGQNYLPAEIELTDAIPENPTQEALQELAPQPQISFEQWSQVIGTPMTELIQDYWYNGEDLPREVESNLDFMASQYGYNSGDDFLQAILLSMPQAQP